MLRKKKMDEIKTVGLRLLTGLLVLDDLFIGVVRAMRWMMMFVRRQT